MQRVPRLAARSFDDVDADREPGWKKGRDRGRARVLGRMNRKEGWASGAMGPIRYLRSRYKVAT